MHMILKVLSGTYIKDPYAFKILLIFFLYLLSLYNININVIRKNKKVKKKVFYKIIILNKLNFVYKIYHGINYLKYVI